MFTPASPDGYREVLPGIQLKTLTHGAKTLFAEFRLKKGSALPRHSHPHEQTGYLVSGALRLTVGAETNDARPGDSWCIAGGVEHEAVALADTVAIEVFSPVREDYLPAAAPR
ncbi:MAG: cupin domain-containing protein [Opitutae bacterium]|nr:cupin domain-containing protein [Opitutae bacterium]